MAAHVFAIVFGATAIATEVSLSSAQSRFGPRLVQLLPFLRTRYGRSLFYMTSGLIIYLICFEESIAMKLTAQLILICGLLYGIIAMQPGNPVDYRGF